MCRSGCVRSFRNVASLCTVSDGFTFEIQPGYIRQVPGTAHRPFPTVLLVGSPFNRGVRKHPFLGTVRGIWGNLPASSRFCWWVHRSTGVFENIRFLEPPGSYGETFQRYRRERPTCRSGCVRSFRNVASLCTVSDGFTFEIQPGYIRQVPGTAHRPFPTVLLVGSPFNRGVRKHPFLGTVRGIWGNLPASSRFCWWVHRFIPTGLYPGGRNGT